MSNVSEHTAADGWPFNPGTPVWWVDAHSRRREGFYLRLDLDDLEDCWGNEEARREFLDKMDGSDDFCLVCESELDDDGECPNRPGCSGDPFHEHPQRDAIEFQRAYGIGAHVALHWPPTASDLEFPTDVPLNQLTPVEPS